MPVNVIVPDVAFPEKVGVIPGGKPVAAPIPVAPVVENVIAVIAVFRQTVGFDEAVVTELFVGARILKAIKLVQPVASVTVKV